MLAVNYHELSSLDSIPRGWRLFKEPIVLVHWRQAHLLQLLDVAYLDESILHVLNQ